MFLPNEILDYILSFLISDLTTLKTCAQSHPTLSELAERYIYAKVIIYDGVETDILSTSWRTIDFTQIVGKTPRIANYVRSLKIHLDARDVGSNLDRIGSLLPKFSALTTIILVADYREEISWHTLPKTFSQAFSDVLHVQTMKTVSIRGMAFLPLSLFKMCQTIRLNLDSCTKIQYHEESVGDILRVPFDHLSIVRCHESMERITAWLQTRNLRCLKYSSPLNFKFYNWSPRLLMHCSNSLTNLDLNIGSIVSTSTYISENSGTQRQTSQHFPFTLVGLLRLEYLTISSRFRLQPISRDGIWSHHSALPAITELMTAAPSSFKQLSLNFDIVFTEEIPCLDIAWHPFIPLADICSSQSILVYVSALDTCPPSIFSSLVNCPELQWYVEKGVINWVHL